MHVCVCSNAKKCYQKALQLNTTNARAAVSLGDCYMADGDEVVIIIVTIAIITHSIYHVRLLQ